MADARLRHHGDGYGVDDALNQLRIGHASHTTLGTNIGGHALQRHDGARAGIFGDTRLFRGHDVHDDAALEHIGQSTLDARSGASLFILLISHSSHHGPEKWSKTRAIFRVLD